MAVYAAVMLLFIYSSLVLIRFSCVAAAHVLQQQSVFAPINSPVSSVPTLKLPTHGISTDLAEASNNQHHHVGPVAGLCPLGRQGWTYPVWAA
jgi:hypothetical protein